MNSTNVVVTSVDPAVFQAVQSYFGGYFHSAFWFGAGLVAGGFAALTFVWMVGRSHE